MFPRLRKAAVAAATAPIRFYRRFISPLKPPCCRFNPTCSAYAISAIEIHGPLVGSLLAIRRILRCNPFGGFGDDPVPEEIRGIRGPFERKGGDRSAISGGKLYKKITTIKDSEAKAHGQDPTDAQ